MACNEQKNDTSIIVLQIQWQRLVDKDQTCPRCRATEAEVDKAYTSLQKSLSPLGIIVALEKKVIDQAAFEKNPSQSNLILIGGRPLEYWLQARTGQSVCCGPCGDTECRTIEKEGKNYETIPAELIIQAGLKAAQLFDVKKKIPCCP